MQELPIHATLPAVHSQLAERNELILQAAPGAGKTTVVPLSLLGEPWLTGKILLLEPRRMAARAVAHRMSQLLGQPVGQQVGYRIRQDTRVGPDTRIEVVTSGVLLNILQEDPSLEDYSLVIFDEFHERSVDADFGLSLCLHARAFMREHNNALKILVMSATLEDERIAKFLNDAAIIRSEGRSYPVAVQYLGECRKNEVVDEIISAIQHAHQHHTGSILAFLPGRNEIQRCVQGLTGKLGAQTAVYPLHGALPLQQQLQAIQPLAENAGFQRKVVLATDIAETSLTIEGISVVVDSGLHRMPIFEPRTGMTRLATRLCSRDSVTQRAGRAGRLGPGTCYRLLSRSTTLPQHSPIDILQADLTQLVLQMLNFGANHPSELPWLDAPPPKSYASAISLLTRLGAVKKTQRSVTLTEHGRQLARFGTHPRLAHMIIKAHEFHVEDMGCFFAAALMEPSRPKTLDGDIERWYEQSKSNATLQPTVKHYLQRVARQQREFLRKLKPLPRPPRPASKPRRTVGLLMALAYPDRIAHKRSTSTNQYQLANGRAAVSAQNPRYQHDDWLAVVETGGLQGRSEDQIYLSVPLALEDVTDFYPEGIDTRHVLQWSEHAGRFIAEKQKCIGQLVIESKRLDSLPKQLKQAALVEFIQQKGLRVLNWSADCQRLVQRLATLRDISRDYADRFPDYSEAALLERIDEWLAPYLTDVNTLRDLKQLNLFARLQDDLTWPKLNELNRLAPEHVQVPSGYSAPVDYSPSPPALQVKLQEMFGCVETPAIANGQLKLTLHLLSPAGRPLQVTQDLAGFWQGSYHEVKKQMKGRYPKHPWPDDPFTATATRFTKKRGT